MKTLRRSGLWVIVLFGFSGMLITNSESSVRASARLTPPGMQQSISKVVKTTGWRLPASGETLVTTSVSTVNSISGSVLKKRLSLSSEPAYDLEIFRVNAGEIVITSHKCVVREIYALEAAQKVFGYEVILVEIVLQDGKREYIGKAYRIYFYDEDGDGVFETFYSSLASLVVPNWAKDK